MNKILLLKTLFLLAVFGSYGQFQESFYNSSPISCDHYSIETAPETAPYSYACAGTFFSGGQQMMHVFTLDDFGQILWQKYVDLGATNCRALDVAIGKNSQVAITGFIESGGITKLYAALYEESSGTLISDYQYTNATNASGSNIIYSTVNDHYIIGGFETSGADGNGLLIALDGGFNQIWATTYDATCDGFNMAVINEIVEVNTEYFITGKLSNASNPNLTGKSQVLAAIVRSSDGSILDNESFRATNSINQEAMGVSAHFNPDDQELVLLYNVSGSPTVDENRPYIAKFRVTGVNLLFDVGFRIDDTFMSNPTGFVSNPSFTGLKILRNDHTGTFIIFGMLDAYGQFDDHVVSVYQEIDISGSLVGPARYWTQSDIGAGYPAQGGAYSFFNSLTLNTDLYTPETTTLNIDLNNFVSILPTTVGFHELDLISSSLNTLSANSPCIEDFEMGIENHEVYNVLCLDVSPATGTASVPVYGPNPAATMQGPTCDIISSPAVGISETEKVVANELTLFANPAHDVLNFSIKEMGTYNAVITNMEGRVLLRSTIANTASQIEINITNLATGLYILSVINVDGQALKQQFVKK